MIKFNVPYITGNELKYISELFTNGHFSGAGAFTDKCQKKISSRIGSEHVLLTDSCTSALEMIALLIRDWSRKQQVLIPSYTFTSTAAAFAKVGFEIIFCEVNPETLMIDAEDAQAKITRHSVAIVGVHYGGVPFDIKGIQKICSQNDLFLIEDAAQGFGSVWEDKPLGAFGDFSAFSFHETKNIHCGLGGAAIIKHPEFFERARNIWERGTNRQEVLRGLVDKYTWVEIGGSFYPSDIQAAFLLAQLDHFDNNLLERQRIFTVYQKAFAKDTKFQLSTIKIPKTMNLFNFHAFWVKFRDENEVDFVREELLKNKISAFIGYVPLHSSPVGVKMGYNSQDLPITDDTAKLILRLPLNNSMTSKDAEFVVSKLFEALDEYRN